MLIIAKENKTPLQYNFFIEVLKNVVIDKQVSYLEQEEYDELLNDYDEKFVVGKHLRETGFDENWANICQERNCDFLTADIGAYHHFFKVTSINLVDISVFLPEKKAKGSTVYRVRISN